MRKLIIILAVISATSCVSTKVLTNLDAISTNKRNNYLISTSQKLIVKYGPNYYRKNSKIEIIQGQISNQKEKDVNMEVEYRKFYTVIYHYDYSKENLEYDYLTKIQIWEDTGKPSSINFGNGYGILISTIEMNNLNEYPIVPYQQKEIFPIYDWQNGLNETNSDPINMIELLKRGYEKQSNGIWLKVRPDIPPRY